MLIIQYTDRLPPLQRRNIPILITQITVLILTKLIIVVDILEEMISKISKKKMKKLGKLKVRI